MRLSVRFGARGHAMEVENISTSMACPRPQKRTETLMLSQVRSPCAGETGVMENRLNERAHTTSPLHQQSIIICYMKLIGALVAFFFNNLNNTKL